jgi:hypothetical protein
MTDPIVILDEVDLEEAARDLTHLFVEEMRRPFATAGGTGCLVWAGESR